jgi:hypothetical protein
MDRLQTIPPDPARNLLPAAGLFSRPVRPWTIVLVALMATAVALVAPRLFDIGGSRFVAVCRMHVLSRLFASGNIDLTLLDAFLYLVVVVSASALWAGRWPRRSVRVAWTRLGRMSDRAFLASTFVLVLGASLLISWQVFGNFPRDVDHVARVFQAHTLASGRISVPAPSMTTAFEAYGVVERDGRWFAKYEPGGAIALAISLALFGIDWVAHPFLGALTPLFVYGALRHWYGRSSARLAILLMALSPFYLFMVSSYHSHVPCLFFLAVYLLFVSRAQRGTALSDAVLAGLFAGLAFTARTYSALLVAWPFAVWLVASKRGGAAVRSAIALAAGGAVPLVALLAYNAALTGDPLLFPFHLADAAQKPWFGYKGHTLVVGILNTLATLKLLNLALFGWPASLLFVAALLLLRKTAADRVLVASSASLVLGYGAYYWSDFSNGPRYYFEALPALAALTARGIRGFPGLVDRLQIRDVDRRRAGDFAGALVALSFAFCALLYLPALVRLYGNHYNANFDLGLDALAREHRLERALVFIDPLPGQNRGFSAGFLANPLDLAAAEGVGTGAKVVYARHRGRRADRRVAALYPGRTVYRLSFDPRTDRSTLRVAKPAHRSRFRSRPSNVTM